MILNKKDIIFAIICGLSVSWIAIDFLGWYGLFFVIIFPILSIAGLWIVNKIGEKYLFVKQFGKFGLAGALADVVDIKAFQTLFWFLPFSDLVKALSFIVGTFVKYFCDKHWAFEKPEKLGMHKEMAKFFLVAILGMGLNVVSFNFFDNIRTVMTAAEWRELSIIFAAIVTSVWNFCGYKFIVFKK
jgi:putative flippase GtrA